jgi:hypothetical protein
MNKNSLSYHEVYPCPVCRHGEIAQLPLMEAYACNFCQHIFTANMEHNLLKMMDSQLPLTWHWNGRNWQGIQREGVEFVWGYWLAGIAFVLLPTTLVGLAAYLFPPLPGSQLAWLPIFWTGLTFFTHLSCLIWLIVEYYQFPVFLYIINWRQRLFRQR